MSGDHNMNQTDSGWRKRQIALDKKAENARELGLDFEPVYTYELVELYIQAAVQAEREACANVCDDMEEKAKGTECCKWPTPIDCAEAIRNRGQA